MRITFEPVRVNTGGADEDGRLVFVDSRLVAVLVCLTEQHAAAGQWYMEHGFGLLDGPHAPTFRDFTEAEAWVRRGLALRSGERRGDPGVPW